jgi:hypothetical protein
MFDAANVVSEGAARGAGEELVWYGTTSLVLEWPPSLEGSDADSRAYIAAVALRDPHVRLRAVRVAHREASLRAPGRLGRAECELRIEARDDGLRIDVDVQAPLTLPSHLGLVGSGPAG